jgi:hypothetical protein
MADRREKLEDGYEGGISFVEAAVCGPPSVLC